MARPLAALNINMLVALDALLQQASVTRAAAETGVSQSAMSHTLAALREHFADPLLVREASGMVLTPKAAQLAEPLKQALRRLEAIVAPEESFDPATTTRQFRLITGDFVAATIGAHLSQVLATEAPAASMVIRPLDARSVFSDLERGDGELAIGPELSLDPRFRRQLIFEDRFVCAFASASGIGEQPLTLERYVALPHLLVSPTGSGLGIVDACLEGLGLSREVVFRVPSFLVAPVVLAGSQLVLTVPQSSIQPFEDAFDLVVRDVPVALPPMRLYAYWHRRQDAQASHRWLLAQIASSRSAPSA
jgi:DNA-binding transcriptional LysR family regulator